MQAVREMNLALIADENLNGKTDVLDKAMSVIQSAGYDVAAYHPLTEGYEVYWVQTLNRVILVESNKETDSYRVVYPEEYANQNLRNDGTWKVFNESVITALSIDMNIGAGNINWDTIQGEATTIDGKSAVVKTSTSSISGSNQTMQLTRSVTKTVLENGTVLISNPTYSIVAPNNVSEVSAETKSEYAKKAGDYFYSLSIQVNEGMIKDDNGITTTAVDIVLPTDVEVDMSNHPNCKPYKIYSGTTKSDKAGVPAKVTNLTFTPDFSYTESTMFDGGVGDSVSKYNVYGYYNVVTGGGIQDVDFVNISLDCPGSNYVLNGKQENANVTAVIGAICPDYSKLKASEKAPAVKVVIDNVHVKGGTITGLARVSGLVGYIGGSGGGDSRKWYLQAGSEVEIKNCSVENVVISGGAERTAYGTAGGFIGYIARIADDAKMKITVDNCTLSGCTISGGTGGGVIGRSSLENVAALDLRITNCTIQNNRMIQSFGADNSNCGYGVIIGCGSKTKVTIDQSTYNSLSGNIASVNAGVTGSNYGDKGAEARIANGEVFGSQASIDLLSE